MASYYYVESKDALLRRVGDYVYASVEVPSKDQASGTSDSAR